MKTVRSSKYLFKFFCINCHLSKWKNVDVNLFHLSWIGSDVSLFIFAIERHSIYLIFTDWYPFLLLSTFQTHDRLYNVTFSFSLLIHMSFFHIYRSSTVWENAYVFVVNIENQETYFSPPLLYIRPFYFWILVSTGFEQKVTKAYASSLCQWKRYSRNQNNLLHTPSANDFHLYIAKEREERKIEREMKFLLDLSLLHQCCCVYKIRQSMKRKIFHP
jgi:hypothetical protein